MNFDKTKTASIALILMLTFSATILALPTVSAHDPAWEVPTWTYMSAQPNPIGTGQTVLLVWWLDKNPPTAEGAYGDRWEFTVDVTKPDGTKLTLGPFTSDPVGSGWTSHTVDQTGTYTFVTKFLGDTLTGLPEPPGGIRSAVNVGDIYLPSESDPVSLTVTTDPVENFPETPLPEGYWTRPISGLNRDWWQISGAWLDANDVPGRFQRYSDGPGSSHIMWTRQITDGGIMGGQFGSIGYYTGLSYEQFRPTPPIIMNGRYYYNVQNPPRYGWYCLDLRTGEELYFKNTTGDVVGITYSGFDDSGAIAVGQLAFGQIYNYESPNQHGGFAYLWSIDPGARDRSMSDGSGDTMRLYDAFTGNYICKIENTSRQGTMVYGKDGSILYFRIDTNNDRLTCWNTSRALWVREFTTNTYWMWRPYLNHTFDGNEGFSLNVSIPAGLTGGIEAIVEGEYIIGGDGGYNDQDEIIPGNLWALSLTPGQEGTLLWNKTFTPPRAAQEYTLAGSSRRRMTLVQVDPENNIFWYEDPTTRKVYVYDLDTCMQIWESDSSPQWDFYGMSQSVAYDMLYNYGYGGVIDAYDIKTGEKMWSYTSGTVGFETAYENTPLSLGCIADGKLYMYSTEHSPTMPLARGRGLRCVDAFTGEELWQLHHWANSPAIAEGYIVDLNLYDNMIYCYGKGPSKTTVNASPKSANLGQDLLIEGTVTDQSAGAKDTPAISDADMDEWMEYLYMQRQMPEDAKGVTVRLTSIDPNGNFQDIGEVTADRWGNFGKSWVPPVPGEYLIMAEFEGSEAYGGSSASTYVVVGKATSPAQPIEPESAAPAAAFAPTEPTQTEPTQAAQAPLITTEVAIIAAVAVATVIGIVSFLALRKRK